VRSAELGRGDQDSLGRALVQHRAVEVAYRGEWNCVAVSLDLDDELSATDRIRIHSPDIDTAVARTLGGHHLHPHGLKERRHEIFEIYRILSEEIWQPNADLVGRLASAAAASSKGRTGMRFSGRGDNWPRRPCKQLTGSARERSR